MKDILIILLMLVSLSVTAQTAAGDASPADGEAEEYVLSQQDIQQIFEDISGYIGELNNLAVMISGARKMNNVMGLETSLQSINVRWTSYYSLQQKDISLSPDLTQMLVNYQQLYQMVGDSINKQKDIITADDKFAAAEKFLGNAKQQSEEFIAEATKWSLTSKTAKQLEGVKTEEQLFFQKIDQQYQAAQAAAAIDPKLTTRMIDLEQIYITLKSNSETVQAAAYKPLLIRLKDYILSLAGVAIIILFITMLQSKLAAIKAAHKAAKDAKKQLMRSQHEIPEI